MGKKGEGVLYQERRQGTDMKTKEIEDDVTPKKGGEGKKKKKRKNEILL